MSRPSSSTYKTRNWPAYNEAIKRRGSLTSWFDPDMSWDAAPSGKRGRQQTYSDPAIQTCLTMKVLFGMSSSISTAPTPRSDATGDRMVDRESGPSDSMTPFNGTTKAPDPVRRSTLLFRGEKDD